MTKKKYDIIRADLMDRCFTILKSNMDYVATQYTKSHVLYPMMETTIYEDFETLIATTIEDAELGAAARGDGSEPID